MNCIEHISNDKTGGGISPMEFKKTRDKETNYQHSSGVGFHR